MKSFALLLVSFAAFAQAPVAVFPQAVVTDAQLATATNNIQTLLANSINSTATSFQVVSATGMAANQIATIDSENVWICGVSGLTVSVGRSACPNVDGRGFDGSSAVSHSANGANCNFGTASGCVSEFVVGWHNNAKNKEIEAVEAYLYTRPLFEAVRDYSADQTGATDSTSALQAGLNAAKAAGACLHVQGSTTRQSFGATYAVPSPYYKISSALTMTGNACLMMDATTTIVQTAARDGLDITGSNNYVSGGVIAYNINATSSTGISVTDTAGAGAAFNNIIGTKVYGNLATGALGKCFAVTSNYGGGSYSNNLLEIYGQFCGTGVYEVGLGVSGPGSNAFVNLGNVTGSIDNSNLAASFVNAGEKYVSLEQNGNQNGIFVDSTAALHIIDDRGGEGAGYRVKFNSSSAFNNTFQSSYLLLPGGIVDLSGGGNNILTPDTTFHGIDINGNIQTCLGCYTNQYFPLVTPAARFSIVDPLISTQRNLFDVVNHTATPTNAASWFLFNPYTVTKNSPYGGLWMQTASSFPAGNPFVTFDYENTPTNGIVYGPWVQTGQTNMAGYAGQYFNQGNSGYYSTTSLVAFKGTNNVTPVQSFFASSIGVFGGGVLLTVSTLPACNSTMPPVGTLLQDAIVSDLTTPTLGAVLTGGGAVRGRVTCGYNGTTSAWHVSAF